MKSRLCSRRVLLTFAFLVTASFGETFLSRHADMQDRIRVDNPGTSIIPPDLGIGASLNGNRPFPSNNAWNMDISRFPVHPNSANLIVSIGNTVGLHPDFGTFWEGGPIGIPYMVVAGNQTKVPMDFIWWPEQSDPGPYPFPPNAPVEGGDASDGDRHVLVIDRDDWKLYETYSTFSVNNGAAWQAGNGAVWNLRSNKLRPAGWTSADAAGLPIFPGLVRRDEVVGQGEIRHALRFTAVTSRRSYVYPATHQAGSTNSLNAPPMGLRVRLKATKNISGFSPRVQVILKAMKKYGMILADNGSNWFVSGTHDPNWDDDELSALSQIKGSDFEVVNTPSRLLMPVADFDGDGRLDITVFRPSDGNWYSYRSGGDVSIVNWGQPSDIPVPGDYDGDGKTDTAFYRPASGTWFIVRSSDGAANFTNWGVSSDKPVAGDYDADGKTDIAVYRPSTGLWCVIKSSDNAAMIAGWGNSTDTPVPGDYDGDGKNDFAVYRSSTGQWLVFRSAAAPLVANWGVATDKPVPGDYDGDGKDDIAVYRPSGGLWCIFKSSDNIPLIAAWGNSTDIPVPGDYDGDGTDDFAVFRNGTWYAFQSTGSPLIASWGTGTDVPIPAAYIP